MPKIVDHLTQKNNVAEALWRLIRRNGMEYVSVRHVAEEAGISVGSLRHYFTSQSDLLSFSMKLVAERVEARVVQHLHLPPGEGIIRIVEELLPLDEERQSEMQVWFSFSIKAMSDPELKALSDQVHEQMRGAFSLILEALNSQGLIHTGLDLELEAKRLQSLVDGLALHGVMHPEDFSPEKIRQVIEYHFKSLWK